MKKIFTRIFPLSLLLLSSCIKGEPRNTEADIVRCILPADILKSEPTIDDNSAISPRTSSIRLLPRTEFGRKRTA